VAKDKKISDSTPKIPTTPNQLKNASDELVSSLARLCDSAEGKVFINLLNDNIEANLRGLQIIADPETDTFVRKIVYLQGQTSIIQQLKTLIEAAPAEQNRRE